MTHIEGPLLAADGLSGGFQYPVPAKHCVDCGAPLAALSVAFYGGAHSGVTWLMQCPTDGQVYRWADYICDDPQNCNEGHQ